MGVGDDLTDAQKRRVAELVERTSFTEDDAVAIVRMASVPREDRDPSMLVHLDEAVSADSVSVADCKRIRRAMKRADSAKEVIDDYPQTHPSVIYRHAQGRCNHDHDVEPTTSPRIKPEECYKIRAAYSNGADVEDLIARFHRSQNTIMRHLFGGCDHDLHDFDREPISEAECHRLRTLYATDFDVRVDDLATAFMVSKGAVHYHLMGKCDHPEDDVIESNGVVDVDECDQMRRAYEYNPSVRQLAKPSMFDRDTGTVYRHVFGKCDHDGDVAPIPSPKRADVNKQDCAHLRRNYKTNATTTVQDLADRYKTGYTTAYEHIFGHCSHGDDREPPARPRHKS